MPLFRIQQLFAAVNVPFKTFPAPFCKKFIAVSISLSVLNCKLAIQSWICVLLLNISSAHFCTFGKNASADFCKDSLTVPPICGTTISITPAITPITSRKVIIILSGLAYFFLFSVFAFEQQLFNRCHRYIKYKKSYYSAQNKRKNYSPQNSIAFPTFS